jgi:signal peptidase I
MRWATGLALAVAVVGVLVLSVGTFTGWLSIQTVPTGSMEPTIRKGSVILVDPVPVDDVEVGDIIVFAAPESGRMTVHRVATIDHDGDGRPVFTTRGDANNGPDPWRLTVDGEHLHRVRYAVPVVGGLLLKLSEPTMRLALAATGAALVLGFGLHHIWRKPTDEEQSEADLAAARPEPRVASDTWHAALDRVLHVGPHHGPVAPAAEVEAASIDEAVDDAIDRRFDALEELVLRADPSPDGGAPVEPAPVESEGSGQRPGATTAVLIVGLVLAGALALPVRTASASFAGTTQASAGYDSLTVAPKTAVTCSWNTATSTTVSWANPNTTDSAQVLVATTSGGSTTVGATAAAGATSVVYSPATPLTTPKFLSTRAVDGTWTSDPSPEMPTNGCRRAINLFAGAGSASFSGDGGAATAANLNAPMQTAEADDGRVFIADSANNRIRVVAPSGAITTFAGGTGTASACTYTGAVASLRLNAPRGVAVDAAGNVYIADTGANCVRMVDTAGNVTRVAGGGTTTACTTTTATAVSLSAPSDVEVDASGNVYVADTSRNCVRKVNGTAVTVVAGGGTTTACTTTTATAVSLSGPLGIDLDASGNVYVADTGRNCVRKVSGTSVTVVAGGGGTTACTANAAATSISLSAPQDVAVDPTGTTAYVADTGRRCVRQVVSGTASLLAFTGTNSAVGDGGPALGATARTPSFLTVLADGDLLVADRATNAGSNDVRRVQLG